MQNNENINEDKLKVHVDPMTLKNPAKSQELTRLQKTNPKIEFDLEPTKGTSSTSSYTTPTTTQLGEEADAVIEPKDKETIKYLSNVKDAKSGEISKPFTIGEKKYQMIRGIKPSKEVVLAVYCHDDKDENGENIIHPVDYFEENIAKPFISKPKGQETAEPVKDGLDYAATEREFHDKENLMDYLNLVGLEGYKHFFVNIKTGEIKAKFKTTKEMIKSGIKLGPDEDYMDIKTLKRFRFGDYFKTGVNEEAPLKPEDAGTNIPKLQSDVKKLTNLIKNKFSIYLSKLDKPIEQAQFLTAMAGEIGVPLNKLSTIINSYKDISKEGGYENKPNPSLTPESRIIKKKEIDESINKKKVIKTIKVKNIK